VQYAFIWQKYEINLQMTQKTLDIDEFIDEIKTIIDNADVVEKNRLFYGHVTIHFARGKSTHLEKTETIK